MARSSADTGKSPFLPPEASAFLRRRLTEGLGALLMLLGVGLLLALFSHDPKDPSGNVATAPGAAISNWLGAPGAWSSDFLLQNFGISGAIIALTFIGWGWRTIIHRGIAPIWLRVLLLIVSILLIGAACDGLDRIEVAASGGGWRLGGWVGASVFSSLYALSNLLGVADVGAAVLAAIAGVIGVISLIGASGFSWSEWRKAGGATASALGTGARGGIEGATIAARTTNDLIARAKRRFGKRPRVEPRFAGELPEDDPDEEPLIALPEPDDEDDDPEIDERPVKKAAAKKPREEPLIEAPVKKAAPGKRAGSRQATLDLVAEGEYQLPPLDLLKMPPESKGDPSINKDSLEQNAKMLKSVLEDFGVKGEILKVRPGPVVTLYELEPAPGIKASRVIGLADDIARNMSAVSARIAVVPGRNVIGIELPNATRETVYLRELLSTAEYESTASKLTLVLGKDIGGAPIMAALDRMPHLLIAGTTGSGKSVAINTMILSLLYRLPPDECRFIMIDPKMLELSVYDGIPHLLAPVVTEPGKAVVALRWTVKEMENRYRAMSQLGVRNIAGYNQRLGEAAKRGENLMRTVQTGFEKETGKPIFEEQPLDLKPLPYIVVVVDEMADLMLVAGKDVESSVQRLSQMARAAGIHLMMATQRPSVDVITGTIKANFPTRCSFQVTSKIDSRTILGESGAEQLLGQGDMLYMAGGGRISRVHGPFVSDEEVNKVIKALKDQGVPEYVEAVTEEDEGGALPGMGGGEGSGDDLYDQAVALVCRERKASTSFVQRHLQIGYNRAARIIERMEAEGVVSSANHVGKREVLARNIEERS
ncbi:MAG TPA: DNA translocase FtsK 4TM domain-containing protein [Alphaproteobacteria bacterium]|nr:DNA translocase FtsK 4TM domain-containing protein [Alphaproteobacteria bacterium]